MHTHVNPIVEITGKPVTNKYGVLVPGSGKTTLSLTSTRVIEQMRQRQGM